MLSVSSVKRRVISPASVPTTLGGSILMVSLIYEKGGTNSHHNEYTDSDVMKVKISQCYF